MKTYFLKNGQKVELVEKINENRFLVNQYMVYQGLECEEYEELSGDEIVVSEIFKSAPKEAIESELKELQDKLKYTNDLIKINTTKINSDNYELKKLEDKKTNLSKLKIDLSQFREAKSISFFVHGKIQPFTTGKLTGYNSDRRFNLDIRIQTNNGKTNFSFSSYWDSDSHFSDKSDIDYDYGFMFDISDEDLKKIAIERCSKMDLSKWNHYDFCYNNKENIKLIEIFFADNAKQRILDIEKENEMNNKQRIIDEIEKQEQAYFKLTGKKFR